MIITQRFYPCAATVVLLFAATGATVFCEGITFTEQAVKLHTIIRERFIDGDTNLVRTRLGNGDPLEDCSLYGGFYLACLVDAFDVSRDEVLREEALDIFEGLYANATVSGIPGFITRGRSSDGSFRGDPSVDQYTGVIYGFWRYFHSPLSGERERTLIRGCLADMLVRFEKNGWRITRVNGEMTTWGRLHSESPTRAERLLSFLLAGYDITGDGRWLEAYREKLPRLLEHCVNFDGLQSWVLIQSQVSLRMLISLETDKNVRAVYIKGSRNLARECLPQVEGFRRVPEAGSPEDELKRFYDESPVFTETIRIPIEAVTVMLLTGDEEFRRDAVSALGEINGHLDPGRVTLNVAVVPWEWNQWLAMKK